MLNLPALPQVEIAFQEVNADVTRYWIDLQNKPEWYTSRINPASKVRSPHTSCPLLWLLTLNAGPSGGIRKPNVGPRAPAVRIRQARRVARPARVRRRPLSGLGPAPKRPSRARARASSSTRYRPKSCPPMIALVYRGEVPGPFVAAVAELQDLLPPPAQFAVGDHFTIADAALAPFLARWELHLRNDVGKFAEGTGPRDYQELFQSERFARLQKYFANISSLMNSFDAVRVQFCPPVSADLADCSRAFARSTCWRGQRYGSPTAKASH